MVAALAPQDRCDRSYSDRECVVYDLRHCLPISTNLFGTTFYSLVGLHASHVIVGLTLLMLVLVLSLRGHVIPANAEHIEMLSWYWHFVDGIWVIVFTVVYIIGR